MKIILLLIVSASLINKSTAQNIGIGTITPNASAALEIKASTKGLLIPRTSTTSRTAIVNPAKGLMVYDTTTSSFWYHNGSVWTQIGAGSGWSLTGNTSTNPTTNFIGTTDAQPLVFRVNKIKAGFIDNSSNHSASFGYRSLLANTTGTGNVAIGDSALASNITGNYNTATGTFALQTNTGSENTANGASSLYFNTTGSGNTATGFAALNKNDDGVHNTANGGYALYLNTSGQQNAANGYGALYSNTIGNYNSAHGAGALNSNIDGLWNTATGAYAMYLNVHGGYNTSSGANALYHNLSGNHNTAIGNLALTSNTMGSYNTAVGDIALTSNISGNYNTAIGTQTMESITTGSQNTALGAFAYIGGNVTNASAIGFASTAAQSNTIQLGNLDITKVSTFGDIFVKGSKGIIRSSDATQQKKVTTVVPVNVTLSKGQSSFIFFLFTESFSADPDVYVGNTIGDGVYDGMIMSISDVTKFGGYLIVNNPQEATILMNFSVKIIAIGAQ